MGLLTEQFVYLQGISAYYIIERSEYLTGLTQIWGYNPRCRGNS
ncbi:hypothetical protein PL9631_1080018 [Planktothrix paucivesiculata PCC 9631]|uniref:Uncharacterized protein n=1 Tax=Planktothrix paucivesiculata PCC 9631 TaxID=671071 RepID=A0A7Z9BHW5_9CYAN|nr:hypothetical protein PL9631_1080018 [Planktothrix paucivesiculata PCC 9631]